MVLNGFEHVSPWGRAVGAGAGHPGRPRVAAPKGPAARPAADHQPAGGAGLRRTARGALGALGDLGLPRGTRGARGAALGALHAGRADGLGERGEHTKQAEGAGHPDRQGRARGGEAQEPFGLRTLTVQNGRLDRLSSVA